MQDPYDAHAMNMIIGTMFVCLVVIPAILYSARNAPKPIQYFTYGAAIFGVVSAVILIMTLLSA